MITILADTCIGFRIY